MKSKEKKLSNLSRSPIPDKIKPMLATLTDKAFNSKDWIFEIKWDGYRTITRKKGKTVSLSSRNLTSFDKKFHTIRKSLTAIKNDFVLDGEVVAVDDNNFPSFQKLQNYQKTGIGNIVYYVFDLLWLKGYNTESLTVIERKELLKNVLPVTDNVLYCDHIPEKGISLFNEAKRAGLEGIIAKKNDSLYYENTRSHNWLKIKTIRAMEAVVCGYTEPRGSRKFFGALILGVYDKGRLTYIGHTGTGFNENNQKQIYQLLQKYETASSPFDKPPKPNAPVTWLKPRTVCEVKYSQLTQDNILRHPVFMRIREDKKADEVTLKSQIKLN